MGYFTESVPQSPAEDFRVRRVEVRLLERSTDLEWSPASVRMLLLDNDG